jgi:hypothetical protein
MIASDEDYQRHKRDGSGYAYCDLPHPAGDAEAKEWCRWYHAPRLPQIPAKAAPEQP